MGQIKFFPTSRCKKINIEELQRLRNMQNLITGARNEMLFSIEKETRYWKAVRKAEFHATIRKEVKLVQ